MQSFAVVTFVFILASVQSSVSGDMAAKMEEIRDNCFESTKVSPEEQERLIAANYALEDAEPGTFCYARCIMEAWGVYSDSAFDEQATKDKFGPVFGEDKLAALLEKCTGEQGEAECETEFKMFTCFNRELVSWWQ